MTWTFVVLLFGVPFSQAALELARRERPQVLDVFRPAVSAVVSGLHGDTAGVRRALGVAVSREFPKTFEDALEKASAAKGFFQPRLQSIVTAWFGFGNDKVVIGRDGWLFYQPGVDYLIGPDITDPAYVALAAKKMTDKQGRADPHPDSREAILTLNRDCEVAGLHLVVLPIPEKAALQAGQLTSRAAADQPVRPPNNRGYDHLVADLRARGVDVFDAAPDRVQPADARYLSQDTHWTPEFMDAVAAALARHVDGDHRPKAVAPAARRFTLRPVSASRLGDLVDMLRLPSSQHLFEPQSVTIQQVIDVKTGRPWQRDPAADVLLVGDSFSNIYSQPAMGWGEFAGLAEHLSYHLGRSVDVIAVNGGGASAAREELARRASASTNGWPTKVIVYEFASRSLMGEDWRPISSTFPRLETTLTPVEAPVSARPQASTSIIKKPVRAPAEADAAAPITVVARVAQISTVPAPGTAPYKDCLTYIRLHIESVESGKSPGSDVIGAFWAMRDNSWLPAATYGVGDQLHLMMIPMEKADRQIQSLQRADDLHDFVLKVFFVLSEVKR